MKIKYQKSIVREVLYSEQYCNICRKFKTTAELKHKDGEQQIFYTAICQKCIEKILKDFKKFNELFKQNR